MNESQIQLICSKNFSWLLIATAHAFLRHLKKKNLEHTILGGAPIFSFVGGDHDDGSYYDDDGDDGGGDGDGGDGDGDGGHGDDGDEEDDALFVKNMINSVKIRK